MKLSKWILITLLATITLLVPVAYVTHALKPQQTNIQTPVATQPLNADTIFNLVNQERVNAGLKPLIRDDRLNATAQAKADEMVAQNYFAHDNPITGKNSAWDNPIFNQICSGSSENIGMTNGYANDNTEQLDWWMNSKPHHDAVLDSRYTLTGVAVNGNKVVQHFCVAK